MKVVYIIFKHDFKTGSLTVHNVYDESAKSRAKNDVDQLNDSVIDDDDVEFSLQSFDVITKDTKTEMF